MHRILVVIALVFAHTAWSDEYEDGLDAYERKDYATAVTKFRSSATKGNRYAQAIVGMMYEYGRGVAQDYKEAVHWYRLAAQQGHPRAQYRLGFIYSNGRGVAQDVVRAHMWHNIAAVNGDEINVAGRVTMESLMSPQQIEQAQRMARECMASNFKKCD